jgi:hypothetical protein
MSEPKPCQKCGKFPKMQGKHRCVWCWLAAQPIGVQVEYAEDRRRKAMLRGAEVVPTEPARPPKKDWPMGYQWCSGCLGFVPEQYARQSRCKAHASAAAHRARLEKVYGIDADIYDALLAWQGGRCYICGNKPRTKRLAVDHNHKTGMVRGLLCADNEYGCNFALGAISTYDRAIAAAHYLAMSPFDRMLANQPPREGGLVIPSTEQEQHESPPRPSGDAYRRGARRYGRPARRG